MSRNIIEGNYLKARDITGRMPESLFEALHAQEADLKKAKNIFSALDKLQRIRRLQEHPYLMKFRIKSLTTLQSTPNCGST